MLNIWGSFGVIHVMRTQEREGVEQRHTLCVKGLRELTHLCGCAKSPFLHGFCNVFICKVLSSYFLVFGDEFHHCFITLFYGNCVGHLAFVLVAFVVERGLSFMKSFMGSDYGAFSFLN